MSTVTNNLQQRAQRLVDVLDNGKQFIEEMLRENDRLRHHINMLENARARDDKSAERLQRLEDENRDFAGRCVEMERQTSNLANLYVTSHQLHSTLDFKEVLQIVQDIVINFIGSECFAILLLEESTGELRTAVSEGSSLLPGIAGLKVRLGEGKLGNAVSTGESYFADPASDARAGVDQPLAIVPLKIKERVIGLLAIYRLLQQKASFSATDYELFSMLAGQAATAIFSAKLYTDAERKLNTIQGFLESLTES